MTWKNLTVKKGVYNKLMQAKKGDESFSRVIQRLLEGKKRSVVCWNLLRRYREFEEATKNAVVEVRKKISLTKLLY